MDNRSLSQTKYRCQNHVVVIPKYREKILYGQMREDVREIIQELCRYKGVEIISGAVCVDHACNAAEVERIKLHGISEEKEHIDDLYQTPNLQSKWAKCFWQEGTMWRILVMSQNQVKQCVPQNYHKVYFWIKENEHFKINKSLV